MTHLSVGTAWRAALLGVAPLLLFAALRMPVSRGQTPGTPVPASPPAAGAPALDTSAVRRAALALAQPRAPSPPAAVATATPGAASADVSAERIQALGRLTEHLYAARDLRRKNAATGAELRKPFTVDELGGAEFTRELALKRDVRLLVLRDGKILWPLDGRMPEGASFDADTRAHATTAGGTLDGAAVAAVRFCPYGEVTCLVDLQPTASALPGPPVAAAPQAAAPDSAALDAALAALAAEVNARTKSASEGTAAPASTPDALLPVWLAAGLSVAVALALWFALFAFTDGVARQLVGAAARLMQAAAGRAPDAAPPSRVKELAALHASIDSASQGLAAAAQRATQDERRREHANALARALTEAASARDLRTRIGHHSDEDAALLAVVDGANRLLESLDRSVLRWQSHAAAASPRAENAAALEQRADALRPLPQLLSETAERLLRVAALPELPPRVVEELRVLGQALGERGKVARGLVDALLLDLATERPADRHTSAFMLLRQELAEVHTSTSAPERVAALQDLAPGEIGERVAPGAS